MACKILGTLAEIRLSKFRSDLFCEAHPDIQHNLIQLIECHKDIVYAEVVHSRPFPDPRGEQKTDNDTRLMFYIKPGSDNLAMMTRASRLVTDWFNIRKKAK